MNRSVWIRWLFAVLVAATVVTASFAGVVSLGGSDVSPIGYARASHGGVHIDDFEDGDETVSAADWEGWNIEKGASNDLTANSSNPISGSYSGRITADGDDVFVNTTANSNKTPTRIASRVRISALGSSSSDQVFLDVVSGGSTVISIELEQSTRDIKHWSGGTATDTGKNWFEDTVHYIEIRDIDYSTDTYDLYLDGGKYVNDASFRTAVSSIDTIRFRVQSSTGNEFDLFIDNVELNGSSYSIDKFDGGTFDTFEDDDQNIEQVGWEGWKTFSGSTSMTDNSLHGDHSLLLNDSGETAKVRASSISGFYNNSRFAAAVNITESTTDTTDGVQIHLEKADTTIIDIEFEPNNVGAKKINVRESGGSTSTGFYWETNITYHVEVRDIDYSADTFDLYINGEDLGTYSFRNSASTGYDEINLIVQSGGTMKAIFDNIEVGGSNFSTPSLSVNQIADFESGLSLTDVSGWGHEWYGNTGDLSTTASAIEGSQSAVLTSNSENINVLIRSSVKMDADEIIVHAKIDKSVSSTSDVVFFRFRKGATDIISIEFEHSSNNIYHWSGGTATDTGTDWVAGTVYTIKVADLNFSSDTYDLWINGTQEADDAAMRSSVDWVDTVVIQSDSDTAAKTVDVTYDDIHAGECTNCDFSIAATTTTGGGGGGTTNPNLHDLTFELVSYDTEMFPPQSTNLKAYYWDPEGDEPGEHLAPNGSGEWVLEDQDTDGFNSLTNQSTLTLNELRAYRLVVIGPKGDRHEWHGVSDVDERPNVRHLYVWGPEGVPNGTEPPPGAPTPAPPITARPTPTPWPSPTPYPRPTFTPPRTGTITPPGPTPWPTPTPPPTHTPFDPEPILRTGEFWFAEEGLCVGLRYWDVTRETTKLTYNFTHNGTSYSDTIHFDPPVGYYETCLDPINTSAGSGGGQWEINGSRGNQTFHLTLGYNDSGSIFGDGEFGFGAPPGAGSRGGGGGGARMVLAAGALIGAYIFREEITKIAQGVGKRLRTIIRRRGP